MAVLIWDKTGERYFEAGTKKTVLFVMNDNGSYRTGVAWSGVTKISENPDGADATDLWADDIKYATYRAAEKFAGSIEAYQSPDEFGECDGCVELDTGINIGQQSRRAFGLAYETTIGNDVRGFDAGYKLHIVYNATASPSSKDYETINDNPDAGSFSWDFETTPTNVPNNKPTSHIEINSLKADPAVLKRIEDMVFGTVNTDSMLPTPEELITLINTGDRSYRVRLNPAGGTIASGKDINSYSTAATEAITLPTAADVTKTGYTFSGWVEVNDLSTVVTTIPTGSTGDKEYIATWTAE